MAIFNQKTINQILENKDVTYKELSHEAQKKLWKAVKSNDTKSIEELAGVIGQEKYDELEKAVKEDYSEYYVLDFFRKEDVPKPLRNTMMHAVFNKVIIENSPSEAMALTAGYIDKEKLYEVAAVLHSVVYFCISHNRTGDYICTALKDSYDIDEDVSVGLDVLYNKNKLSLKLDYIINVLTSEEDE